MKRETVSREFHLVDEDGIVRRINITLERDPGILIELTMNHYVDENGTLRDFVGMLVPHRENLERIDLTKQERVGA